MTDFERIADRIKIEALRGEFSDAAMLDDYDRLASLFTDDGVLRIPHIDVEAVGPDGVRAFGARRDRIVRFFVQTTHPGVIRLDGDRASGRAYISELIGLRDGGSHLNHAIYHDSYRRTADGWRFAERVYEIRYVDTTPLGGAPR